MKLYIPPGTVATQFFSRVTLDFMTEKEATDFLEWLREMDNPANEGLDLQLNHKREKVQ